jgi:hypothetical protein
MRTRRNALGVPSNVLWELERAYLEVAAIRSSLAATRSVLTTPILDDHDH